MCVCVRKADQRERVEHDSEHTDIEEPGGAHVSGVRSGHLRESHTALS